METPIEVSIKGVERFAVPEWHHAYNTSVGLLFGRQVSKEEIQKLLDEYEVVIVRAK